MLYFLEKNWKIAAALGLRPQTPEWRFFHILGLIWKNYETKNPLS